MKHLMFPISVPRLMAGVFALTIVILANALPARSADPRPTPAPAPRRAVAPTTQLEASECKDLGCTVIDDKDCDGGKRCKCASGSQCIGKFGL